MTSSPLSSPSLLWLLLLLCLASAAFVHASIRSSSSFSFLCCRHRLSPSTIVFHQITSSPSCFTLIHRSLWLLLPSYRRSHRGICKNPLVEATAAMDDV
ncbi:uncharacterized protein G2W53_043379 [Senna tora]|uniref:Secreted protein n=1 Tax=Senna tora TaxID=362788 RepID=A0A834SKM9_9FABA|nr:uncharacterized protein G2W53_043379 [Senna tora]